MAERECENTSCNGDCNSCSGKNEPESLLAPLNQYSSVKKVIGVVSGKGGVGKSLVTGGLAVAMNRMGYKTAILDADITGPSIPKMFGINSRALQNEMGILPAETKNGTKIMSVNLLLDNSESPVIWRGPVVAGAVKQFWTEVFWGDNDYMFIDCPPGTGDVPLTVFQSIKLDGIVIVTSPQDLVSMIVKKAYNMAKLMNIQVLGIVENYSYVACPDCGKHIQLFGTGGAKTVADELNLPLLAEIPIDPDLAAMADNGSFENMQKDYFTNAAKYIDEKLK